MCHDYGQVEGARQTEAPTEMFSAQLADAMSGHTDGLDAI